VKRDVIGIRKAHDWIDWHQMTIIMRKSEKVMAKYCATVGLESALGVVFNSLFGTGRALSIFLADISLGPLALCCARSAQCPEPTDLFASHFRAKKLGKNDSQGNGRLTKIQRKATLYRIAEHIQHRPYGDIFTKRLLPIVPKKRVVFHS
jgi:hypothetical protein